MYVSGKKSALSGSSVIEFRNGNLDVHSFFYREDFRDVKELLMHGAIDYQIDFRPLSTHLAQANIKIVNDAASYGMESFLKDCVEKLTS